MKSKLDKHASLTTARICIHIIVHNCHTKHSRQLFWLSSLYTSRRTS